MQNRWMSIADPIHGLIQFDRFNEDHRLLLDVMNSKAFQRLRRINQMGLAEFVFPGATHSRFVHCLGATHLMLKVVEQLRKNEHNRAVLESHYPGTQVTLNRLLLICILTHDIGHSPLSHTLEDVLGLKEKGLSHDYYWKRKILTEDPELQRIWQKYNPDIPKAILAFLGEEAIDRNSEPEQHFLSYLVSSQLDMDRLDYLQRDSHFLGVQYGRIEAERIISSLDIAHLPDKTPVMTVREEAIPAVEHYLFGRHQAYKMALHSLDKASESLLKKTLERFRWAVDNGFDTGHPAKELYQLMVDGNQLSVDRYLRMDDNYLWEAIHSWSLDAADPWLKELANRLMRHDLFKFIDVSKYGHTDSMEAIPELWAELQQHYIERDLPFEFSFDEATVKPKPLYQVTEGKEPIWIQTQRGVVHLTEASSLALTVAPQSGHKHLVFLWDRHAKEFLRKKMEARFPKPAP